MASVIWLNLIDNNNSTIHLNFLCRLKVALRGLHSNLSHFVPVAYLSRMYDIVFVVSIIVLLPVSCRTFATPRLHGPGLTSHKLVTSRGCYHLFSSRVDRVHISYKTHVCVCTTELHLF